MSDRVESENKQSLHVEPPRYRGRQETASYLGISVRHLDNLCHNDGLPFYEMGRRHVFALDEVNLWMASHRRVRAR